MVQSTPSIMEEDENHELDQYEHNRRTDTSLVSNQNEQLQQMTAVPRYRIEWKSQREIFFTLARVGMPGEFHVFC